MKRLAVLLCTLALAGIAAEPSSAYYNTGWPCSTPGQLVNAGGGYWYLCFNNGRPGQPHWWLFP